MENKEKVAEIIKWLYIHDGFFDSSSDWREAFVQELEEVFLD